MENAFAASTQDVLSRFSTSPTKGLTSNQITALREEYGSNSLPEDPPTPLWELILEQFKDQLVLILLGSAAISFVLALFEGADDWTAFVDPVVVGTRRSLSHKQD